MHGLKEAQQANMVDEIRTQKQRRQKITLVYIWVKIDNKCTSWQLMRASLHGHVREVAILLLIIVVMVLDQSQLIQQSSIIHNFILCRSKSLEDRGNSCYCTLLKYTLHSAYNCMILKYQYLHNYFFKIFYIHCDEEQK